MVTWRHRSRDDSIPHMGFPIGAPLEPSSYLHALSRYLAPNISGLRLWPFAVTWRHWSCDHLMPHVVFPIGVPLYPTLYLQPFSRYRSLNILGWLSWPFKVTRRHRSRDDSIPHIGFPIGVPLELSPYLQAISMRFRDIWLQIYRGYDFDLLWSRDVIGHVTIWCYIWHFL